MKRQLGLISVGVAIGILLFAIGGLAIYAAPAASSTATAAEALSGAAQVAAPVPEACVDFEDPPLGSVYHVGDTFTDSGVTIKARPFVWSSGISTDTGEATIVVGGQAGGTGQEVNLNNISLSFDHGGSVPGLSFLFGEYGGNLNLEVNGDFRNFDNFHDIDGAVIGGVHVAVINGLGNDMGSVWLFGTVNSFAVGGQELFIDHVCRPRDETRSDLGDAPATANHFTATMHAYPAVTAEFPTVFFQTLGPVGPRHYRADLFHLGEQVSFEQEADLGFDQDPSNNIVPPPDIANQDEHDDGLKLDGIRLPNCERSAFDVQVYIDAALLATLDRGYVNIWFDGNRNGTWDVNRCTNPAGVEEEVPEHVVIDAPVDIGALGAGLHSLSVPTTVPIFNPEPDRPAWLRVTLSGQPSVKTGSAGGMDYGDGRGINGTVPPGGQHEIPGFWLGETEDYLIPGAGQPQLEIRKTADVTHTVVGGQIVFTVTVTNAGAVTATGVTVEDPIPAGTHYVSGTVGASFGSVVYDSAGNKIVWNGDIPPGATLEIHFTVKVAAVNDLECRSIRNVAHLMLAGVAMPSNPVEIPLLCPDVGDAPDSSNHPGVGMTAYGTVTATFPTVYDLATGAPPGPAHWMPRKDAWLGEGVSRERDADLMPDEDGHTNLRPAADVADLDMFDDGVHPPRALRHCEPTTVTVTVNVVGPVRERYINAWFDWNRDGDWWEDAFECTDAAGNIVDTAEWAVRDYVVNLGPGVHNVALPAFLPYNPEPQRPLWARFTLAEQPAPVDSMSGLADGRGPDAGYRFGETEDYLVPGVQQPPEVRIVKTADVTQTHVGGVIEFQIAVVNQGNTPISGAVVEDQIPAGTQYVAGSLGATSGTAFYDAGQNRIVWTGNIPAGGTVMIHFKVRVVGVASGDCNLVVRNIAHLAVAGVILSSNPVEVEVICQPPPDISIVKKTPVTVTMPGGLIDYSVIVSNTGGSTAAGIVVEDEIPAGTSFAYLDPASGAVYDPAHNQIRWQGDLPPNSAVHIQFGVRVAVDIGCEGRIKNRAYLITSNGTALASGEVVTHIICPDVGDAPDSSNHHGAVMTAYGFLLARFPTVYDSPTGLPRGPAHWLPRKDAWLGRWVSRERDADLVPDEDGHPNLRPLTNEANLDEHDDGVGLPNVLRHCEPVNIPVVVTVVGPQRDRYINAWFDWNRDGDWEDAFDCNGAATAEWAIRDYVINLGPGVHTVVLPAILPFNPEPRLPIWARFTLSEGPAVENPLSGLADGRGPDAGYRYGETEDYLIPGQHVQPKLEIHKEVDKRHASVGDELEYTIVMQNDSTAPATAVHMQDAIPAGTVYISGTLWASKPLTSYVPGQVMWDGDIDPAETVTVTFKVRIEAAASVSDLCDGSIRNVAVLVTPDGVNQTSDEVYTHLLCPDLGDAPDSTNHHAITMTTYPSPVVASFPTVYDPATGTPSGPIHWRPTQDSWLGPRARPPSGERDADQMPDQDGRTNIWPPDNKADRDERDNGVALDSLDLPHCQATTLTYRVTIVGPQRERYVNVWFDWNRDGDWADRFDCPVAAASEWAVRNQVLAFGPGEYTVTTPLFLPWHPDPGNPDQPMWMRITLSERPVPAIATIAAGSDGSGPDSGYKYGETEDYYLGRDPGQGPPDVWVTKELRRVDFGGPDATAAAPGAANLPHFYFHIEYGNSGGSPAADVVVTDTLPMSLTYRASQSVPDVEPPTVVTPTVSWNIGTLYPGSTGVINLAVRGLAHIPPGTVLTNTVIISTTTAGDDPNNNTAVVTGTMPLLPPRIIWPIPGTTCTGTLTVTGKSQVGTFVDLYVDGVYTATTTVDAQGIWDVPLTLSDGTHAIYAKARLPDGTESLPSPTVVVIVDSTLLWDPMSMTFTTVWPNGWRWVQHIRDEDGRADPDGWKVALRTGITTTQPYTVSVRICCEVPTGVTLTVGSDVYTMTDVGGGWHQTVINAPGLPSVPITLEVKCGSITGGGGGSGLIDPDGYVFDVDVGRSTTNLADQTVTCLEYDESTASWDRWPAELYESQVNPQTTASDGYYSFFTPPGDYQITVEKTAEYQSYRSWTLTVISTPVHLDIPLTPVYAEADYAVSVDAAGFVPATLEVVQGSVVEWTNSEGVAETWHTTTSDLDARTDTRGWDSGLLDSGQSYRRRFDTLGTFTYSDHENPGMQGTIKVCYLYDLNCDEAVDINDIVTVAQLWGATSGAGNGYDARYDVDGNDVIDIVDILLVTSQWQWAAP